VVLLENFFDEL